MVPALEEVARNGFTEEAKMSAQRTLAALKPAAVTAAPHATDAARLCLFTGTFAGRSTLPLALRCWSTWKE